MTFYYPAIVKKTGDIVRVTVPDLEMCYGEGDTEEDALEDARSAAIDWIQLEMSENLDLPFQTALSDIKVSGDERKTMLQIIMPREGWDE